MRSIASRRSPAADFMRTVMMRDVAVPLEDLSSSTRARWPWPSALQRTAVGHAARRRRLQHRLRRHRSAHPAADRGDGADRRRGALGAGPKRGISPGVAPPGGPPSTAGPADTAPYEASLGRADRVYHQIYDALTTTCSPRRWSVCSRRCSAWRWRRSAPAGVAHRLRRAHAALRAVAGVPAPAGGQSASSEHPHAAAPRLLLPGRAAAVPGPRARPASTWCWSRTATSRSTCCRPPPPFSGPARTRRARRSSIGSTATSW